MFLTTSNVLIRPSWANWEELNSIAEKIVEDSIYQHVGITEPHYSLPPNTHDYSNTNPLRNNKITLIWETRVEAKKNLWKNIK